MVGGFLAPTIVGIEMKYFKKPNGSVIEYDPQNHDLKSLKSRFDECQEDASPKPKAKKKKD